MTSQQILQSDLLDIIFEKRNKLYGAYQLRKRYPYQLVKALVATLALALLLLLFINPSASVITTIPEKEKVVVVDQFIQLKKEERILPSGKPVLPRIKQVKQQFFTTHITMTNNEIINPLPPQDLFDYTAVPNVTTTGIAATTFPPPLIGEGDTKSEGNATAQTLAFEEVIPDKQPQFPGGMQAWLAFLSRHLRSPQDLDVGEKRTVLIRFHVAEDGIVTNFHVQQSAGSVFDNEVVRVLKKMPKWTPAIKAGQPVSVSFTQPVTFVGMEE